MNALLKIIAVAVCLLSLGARAEMVGVSFGGISVVNPAPLEIAGVRGVQQRYWNATAGASGTLRKLTDSRGYETGMEIAWAADAEFSDTGLIPSSPDRRLMFGFLLVKHSASAPEPRTLDLLQVKGVPYPSYDVIVYLNTADWTPRGFVEIGAQRRWFQLARGTFNGAFRPVTSTDERRPSVGNYVRFTGLSGSEFAVRFQRSNTTVGGAVVADEAGVAAIQIVNTAPQLRPPTAITLAARPVVPGLTAGAILGTLAVQDPDTGDAHRFSLVAGSGGTDNALCRIVGDQLVLRARLTRRAGVLRVRVRATDLTGKVRDEIFTVPIATATTGAPVISEFLASNESGLRDVDGNRRDWIELHNPHAAPLLLGGSTLTDDPTQPARWTFPANAVLAPGERLVVFASDKDRRDGGGELHTNFRLQTGGASGERYLALGAPGGAIVHGFLYPAQAPDISCRVAADGTTSFFSPPTPGTPEGAPFTSVAGMPRIVGAARVGIGSATLQFEAPADGAAIHYTLDGTIPTEASPAASGSVVLTQSRIVTARAFAPGRLASPVLSTAFAVLATAPPLGTTPVVILDTFGVRLQSAFGARNAVEALAIVLPGGDLAASPDFAGVARVKVRGTSSAAYDKRNFSLELHTAEGRDRDVSLVGMPAESDWVLNAAYLDGSRLRDPLTARLWRETGRYAPRVRAVEMLLNQSDALDASDYAGLYNLTEKIKTTEERVYAATGAPLIFSVDRFHDAEESAEQIVSQASNPAAPSGLRIVDPDEPHEADRDALAAFIGNFEVVLGVTGYADRVRRYRELIDVPSWIDMHILQEFTRNIDAFRFSFFGTFDGARLALGPPWDFDRAYGNSEVLEEAEGWVHRELSGTQYP